MPEVRTEDAVLHVEVDGGGEPVTVLAHGITGSCAQLAPVTPVLPGTKVRFCFRGHGHSVGPEDDAYGYRDLARDLLAVADAHGATRAAGVSLGAAALCSLLAERPDRFERLVFLLPAVLDRVRPGAGATYLALADRLERMTREEAGAVMLRDEGWRRLNDALPGMTAEDAAAGIDPRGLARAIRGVVGKAPLEDASVLSAVRAPSLVIGLEGDPVHPVEVARRLHEVLPDSELIVFRSVDEIRARVVETALRAAAFLEGR